MQQKRPSLAALAAMLLLVCASGLPAAMALGEWDDSLALEEDDQARFLTLNTNSSITTMIPTMQAFLAVILVGILILIVYSGVGATERNGYGYGEQPYAEEDPANSQFYARTGQYLAGDLAMRMQQLEAAFDRYGIYDLECRMYVACDSAYRQYNAFDSAVARQVFGAILSTRSGAPELPRGEGMRGVRPALEYGQAALADGKEDACNIIREKCFAGEDKKYTTGQQ